VKHATENKTKTTQNALALLDVSLFTMDTQNQVIGAQAGTITADVATVKASKGARKVKAAGELTKLIAIGSRGTAFAFVDAQQLGALKLGELNVCMAKLHRTRDQLAARHAGRHQGVLWADSCSWIESRDNGKFWIGELAQALKLGKVRKASITVSRAGKQEKLVGYVRADFTSEQALSKAHRIIATESALGRVECVAVDKETGEGKARNDVYLRKVEKIELSK
jgi:hypothetical protein